LLSAELVTELAQAGIQAMTTGMLAKDQASIRPPNRLRCHNFVGKAILQDAVLVNACFVSKGICTHHRFIWLHRNAGQAAYELAGRQEFLRMNARIDVAKGLGTYAQSHNSPRPLMVTSTWRAPALIAANVFAVAMPRSSWQ
jgi:hypothetical protein